MKSPFRKKSPFTRVADSQSQARSTNKLPAPRVVQFKARTPYVDIKSINFLSKPVTQKAEKKHTQASNSGVPRITTTFIPNGEPRYEGETQIGEGGTAIVYKAIDRALRRPVAIKRFNRNSQNDTLLHQDFLAEVESISRIQHKNVVQTYDVGFDNQGEFIVMELIKGQDLELELEEKGTLGSEDFRDFAIQCLEGLAATHEGGILHLDLKPSNIMINRRLSGQLNVTIVDFGRARLSESIETDPVIDEGQNLVGSVFYMSPEQLKKKDISESSDLYALGCVFYTALTGKRPFDGDTAVQVMSSHLQNRHTPLADAVPDISSELADWVTRLIARKPENRPDSVMSALKEFLATTPLTR